MPTPRGELISVHAVDIIVEPSDGRGMLTLQTERGPALYLLDAHDVLRLQDRLKQELAKRPSPR